MFAGPCTVPKMSYTCLYSQCIITTMNVRIFEIFTSVEGEGILYGTKTLFVRLAGCPFTCFYCDTTEALPANSGTEYTIHDAKKLIDENLQRHTYKVNFTGGDPLMQHKAVALLAKYVQAQDVRTYLESSCFDSKRFVHVLPYFDYIKIEFKTPDSEFVNLSKYDTMYQNVLQCLTRSVQAAKTTYIKVVVSSRTTLQYLQTLVCDVFDIVESKELSGFVIQPTYGIQEPSLNNLLKMYDTVHALYCTVHV